LQESNYAKAGLKDYGNFMLKAKDILKQCNERERWRTVGGGKGNTA
jgi:hypothetical protein